MERTMKKSLKGTLSLMGLCTVMSLAAGLTQADSGPAYWMPSGAPQPSMNMNLQSTLLNGLTQSMTQQMMQQMGLGQMSSFMGPMGAQMGMANGLMGSALGANLNLTQMMQGMAAQVVSQLVTQGLQKIMSGGGGSSSSSQGSAGASNLLAYNPNDLSMVNGTTSGLLGSTSNTPSFNTAMLGTQNLGTLLGTVVADATGGITGATTSNNASLGTGGLY